MAMGSSLSRAAKKIKHPGVEIAKAKRNGISTHEQLVRDSHSSDAKTRARGNLGLALSKSAKRRSK
ncbi:hypothetical protein UFOVP134_51 [uncultured Caudovirales phage]|uniref:Uncharacterized protein n=1 Tax=uncultured Caudovirales phage TaxID=2100421 RepID=A0A6J5LC44_9CAUD|nr:hypothetical protein UFOVP134_51 [uncultured Caudovirales phage]